MLTEKGQDEMGMTTEIAWTDATINTWWGCKKINQGCKFCYAADLSKRFGFDVWGESKPYREIAGAFPTLMKIQRKARMLGTTHRVFVGSMMDIFDDDIPLVNKAGELTGHTTASRREALMHRIHDGAYYPDLEFQLLTKRPSNIQDGLHPKWQTLGIPKNVWIGVSAANQQEAEEYGESLVSNTPTDSNLFLSLEPMIDEIYLRDISSIKYIKWIIVGGESGKQNSVRAFEPAWATHLIAQARHLGIPIFIKQMGTIWANDSHTKQYDIKGGNPEFWPGGLNVREFPK